MARKPRLTIDVVLDHDRQLAALRAANLRRMHEQSSRQGMQVAGVLAAGAVRNAASGVLPLLVAQPRQHRGRRS